MRAPLLAFALGLAVSAATAIECQAMERAGPARVIEGDTLEIGSQSIRIHGIDAPEASQVCQLPKGTWDCSAAVVNVLRAMVEGHEVRCAGREFDQYGRLIARCATEEVPDIGAQLVASGLAWAFVKYSTDYVGLEKASRAKRIGIWQSKTQPPWEYSARRWETAQKVVSSEGGCPIKGNINAKGARSLHARRTRSQKPTCVDHRMLAVCYRFRHSKKYGMILQPPESWEGCRECFNQWPSRLHIIQLGSIATNVNRPSH